MSWEGNIVMLEWEKWHLSTVLHSVPALMGIDLGIDYAWRLISAKMDLGKVLTFPCSSYWWSPNNYDDMVKHGPISNRWTSASAHCKIVCWPVSCLCNYILSTIWCGNEWGVLKLRMDWHSMMLFVDMKPRELQLRQMLESEAIGSSEYQTSLRLKMV